MEIIHEAVKAYNVLIQLRNDGYSIEELVDMLPDLNITIEILEEIVTWA